MVRIRDRACRRTTMGMLTDELYGPAVVRDSVGRRGQPGGTAHAIPSVARALLIVNRKSGVGHSGAVINSLRAILEGRLAAVVITTAQTVDGHEEARALVSRYLGEGDAPAAIIVGGGAGRCGRPSKMSARAARPAACRDRGADNWRHSGSARTRVRGERACDASRLDSGD